MSEVIGKHPERSKTDSTETIVSYLEMVTCYYIFIGACSPYCLQVYSIFESIDSSSSYL